MLFFFVYVRTCQPQRSRARKRKLLIFHLTVTRIGSFSLLSQLLYLRSGKWVVLVFQTGTTIVYSIVQFKRSQFSESTLVELGAIEFAYSSWSGMCEFLFVSDIRSKQIIMYPTLWCPDTEKTYWKLEILFGNVFQAFLMIIGQWENFENLLSDLDFFRLSTKFAIIYNLLCVKSPTSI